jgi:hypothetical protein
VADLAVDGNELVLHLHAVEKAEGFHGDVRVPLTAVESVRAVDDAWPELRGIRAPGTGVRGVIALGTRRHPLGRDFVAVYGKGPATVVELAGLPFLRLVVSSPDAARVAAEIRGAVRGARSG